DLRMGWGWRFVGNGSGVVAAFPQPDCGGDHGGTCRHADPYISTGEDVPAAAEVDDVHHVGGAVDVLRAGGQATDQSAVDVPGARCDAEQAAIAEHVPDGAVRH